MSARMLNRVEFARNADSLFEHVGFCWQEARTHRLMPRRQDISPGKLGPALPYISLIDVIDETPIDFQYRLIGQHLITHTGQNLKGKRSSELPPAGDGRPLYRSYAQCIETGEPVAVALPIKNLNGTMRLLHWKVWPLGEPGMRPNGLLGAALFPE
jgi:hypothetical protein